MSQTQLADASGLSRRMIAGIENGAANASLATVDRISAALGVSFTQMVRPPGASSGARIEEMGWRGEDPRSCATLLGAAPGHTETELWTWTLAPGEKFASEEIAGTWHEVLLVLAGELTLTWQERTDVIKPNDFRIFNSKEPYQFSNERTELLRYLRILVL